MERHRPGLLGAEWSPRSAGGADCLPRDGICRRLAAIHCAEVDQDEADIRRLCHCHRPGTVIPTYRSRVPKRKANRDMHEKR